MMKTNVIKCMVTTFALTTAQFAFATNCTSSVNNSAVQDLTVPAGATCTLNNTGVSGSVSVQKGATLILNNASVQGSVQASTAKSIKLVNSMIEGDLNVAQASSTIILNKSMISGNLYCLNRTGFVGESIF